MLKIGDILLLRRPINFYTRLIKKFTKSRYVHAAIISYYDTNKKLWAVAEATRKGFVVNLYPEDYILENYTVLRKEGLTYSDYADINYWVSQHLGVKYGWWDILKILFNIRSQKNTKKLICSEAVARILEEVYKIPVRQELGKEFDLITPKDIYNLYPKYLKRVN